MLYLPPLLTSSLNSPQRFLPMSSFQSHLSVLQSSATRFPSRNAFLIAQPGSNNSVDTWLPVTYKQFYDDDELSARYWHKELSAAGLSSGSVVGLW